MLKTFDDRRNSGGLLATDQLLNTFFLVTRGSPMTETERKDLENILLKELGTK